MSRRPNTVLVLLLRALSHTANGTRRYAAAPKAFVRRPLFSSFSSASSPHQPLSSTSSSSSSLPLPEDKPIALPKHLSPSSIEAWKQCPLVFKSRYIDKIKEPPTTALARGIAAHDGLEKVSCARPTGRPFPARIVFSFSFSYYDALTPPASPPSSLPLPPCLDPQLYTTIPPQERSEQVLHDLFRAAWGAMRKEERYAPLFGSDRESERQVGKSFGGSGENQHMFGIS